MVVGPKSRLIKQRIFPRPHDMRHAWMHGLETGVNNATTIYPIHFYDEGLGAPSGYNSNPQHASFAEASEANCYVDSDIQQVVAEFTLSLTKGALETDKLHAVNVSFMPIFYEFNSVV